MKERKSESVFNSIAPIYGLFYQRQKKGFSRMLGIAEKELGLSSFKTILDVGCGTGALCAVLSEKGFTVTGVDSAEKMLSVARKKPENSSVRFVSTNILEKLAFDDKSYDISIASYVAHGMNTGDRSLMYSEMGRVTKSAVLIYDYNQKRSLLTSVIEWLEGGHYFNFIKNPESEMMNCVHELRKCFEKVKVVDIGARSALYVCTPRQNHAEYGKRGE